MNSRFLTVFLFLAALFSVWLIIGDYPQNVETKRQLKDIKDKIEALKKDEERQKSMAEYLGSESYLEKQARLRLNLKKEGEEVVFVYRKDETAEPQGLRDKNENPFLSKLKELIRILMPK